MPIPYKRALALFEQLGEKDAEDWATAESDEPSLARFLFLKALWSNVIDEDSSWMKDWAFPKDPIPSAIARMLRKGIDPDDLTDVVRDMQVELLFNVCCALDSSGHGIEDIQEVIPENIEWRLAEWDGKKEVVKRPILDVHDSFYDFDPTGRAGAPRKRGKKQRKKT